MTTKTFVTGASATRHSPIAPRHALRRALASCALAALLSALGACASGEADSSRTPVVRDSAGIRIVESAPPAAAWGVVPEPLLVIGAVDGEEAYLLSNVTDARFLPDGGVALLDGGTRQLRLYAQDGTFRAAFGGEGDGPGEFRLLADPLIHEPDGGFLLWDAQLRRITRVGPDLTAGPTITPEGADGARTVLLRDRFGDGTLLVSEARSGPPPTSGMYYDTLHLHRADASGRLLNALLSVANTTGEIAINGGPDPATITSISIRRTPMGSAAATAVSGDVLLAGHGSRPEVRAVNLDGSLRWIARLPLEPRPIGDAEREAFVDQLAESASLPDAIRRAYVEMTFPATMPAFDQWVVDDEGHLWMRSYRAPFDEGPSVWHVLDAEGVWVASATLPGSLRPTHVSGERVLGVFQDELGLESVRVYAREGG